MTCNVLMGTLNSTHSLTYARSSQCVRELTPAVDPSPRPAQSTARTDLLPALPRQPALQQQLNLQVPRDGVDTSFGRRHHSGYRPPAPGERQPASNPLRPTHMQCLTKAPSFPLINPLTAADVISLCRSSDE